MDQERLITHEPLIKVDDQSIVTIIDEFRHGAEIANETEHTDELLVDESGKFKELTFRKIKG